MTEAWVSVSPIFWSQVQTAQWNSVWQSVPAAPWGYQAATNPPVWVVPSSPAETMSQQAPPPAKALVFAAACTSTNLWAAHYMLFSTDTTVCCPMRWLGSCQLLSHHLGMWLPKAGADHHLDHAWSCSSPISIGMGQHWIPRPSWCTPSARPMLQYYSTFQAPWGVVCCWKLPSHPELTGEWTLVTCPTHPHTPPWATQEAIHGCLPQPNLDPTYMSWHQRQTGYLPPALCVRTRRSLWLMNAKQQLNSQIGFLVAHRALAIEHSCTRQLLWMCSVFCRACMCLVSLAQ